MKQESWAGSKQTSQYLGVSETTLRLWREIGYLKAGTHWRSAPGSQSKPWEPEVIYHLRWCKEEMEYWRSHNARIIDQYV